MLLDWRWRFRRFRPGPQSDAHGYVSSPRSPNPACRFPAPGSPVESCGSHTGSRSRPAVGSCELWHEARTLAPVGRCVVRPVDALTAATAGGLFAPARIWSIRAWRRPQDVVVAGASSDRHSRRVLAAVKARRCAPPPLGGALGLDGDSADACPDRQLSDDAQP